jgi:predicted RNase H-like nuclease (RuvC/YqgF family)
MVLGEKTMLQASVRDITELKKATEELQKRLHELEVFYKAAVGREEKILELKKEIEQLKKELGK